MAIYHLHAQIIGRAKGRSACAAAAYRSTSKIADRTTGETFDFTKKKKAIVCKILAPKNIPKEFTDRNELWNMVEEKENRKNSQFAREIDAAIPIEIVNEMLNIAYGNIEMAMSVVAGNVIDEFCKKNFVNRGLVCDYAIHNPDKKGDQSNYHVHIMITTRKVDAAGWAEKDREANHKDFLKGVRQSWQDICNSMLSRIGSKERIDCRSLAEQGIDREPQRHQGVVATAMERNGKAVDRTRFAKKTGEYRNDEVLELENRIKELENPHYVLDEMLKEEYAKELRLFTQFQMSLGRDALLPVDTPVAIPLPNTAVNLRENFLLLAKADVFQQRPVAILKYIVESAEDGAKTQIKDRLSEMSKETTISKALLRWRKEDEAQEVAKVQEKSTSPERKKRRGDGGYGR